MKKRVSHLLVVVACLLATACMTNQFLSPSTRSTGNLSEETILLHASSGPLKMERAQIITGNDAAFHSKLKMINTARSTIDAMYYIYGDDYTSSVLTEALIAAARRGVGVRLLVDYHTNYKNLDLFSMMENLGNAGAGSLDVRFYNRPTQNIIKDAVYLTMGCGDALALELSERSCTESKFGEIEQSFTKERIDGRPAVELGISNLNMANSGLFLSGLYSKKPDIIALAVLRGQDIDTSKFANGGTSVSPEDKEDLKKIGKIYLQSRAGTPFRRLTGKLQLGLAFLLYGETLNPIYESIRTYLPVERQGASTATRDWEYLTDFLHHKLLLIDNRWVQLGGRNIEDSYHMRPNEMLDKYVFMDTDLEAELSNGGEAIGSAFDALWNFRTMVASIPEIRRHAPNDFAANHAAFVEAQENCETNVEKQERENCTIREFDKRALSLAERETRRHATIKERAQDYKNDYLYREAPDPSPTFPIDQNAFMTYIENLPFYGGPDSPPERRSYGSENGQEAKNGKRIHAILVAELEQACKRATASKPQEVILHNAYFFPPSNLISSFGQMFNGALDCRNLTVTVLTNSIETTDLNVVNLLARHSVKAFADYYQSQRDPERSAQFRYYEYQKPSDDIKLSLHTKVFFLAGDMFVGSANADVRSYIMDSNNGMLIRSAPQLIEAYGNYLHKLLQDPSKTKELTTYFANTTRDQLISEDRDTFHLLTKKYGVERWLDAEQLKIAERNFVDILNLAYRLTKKSLAEGREGQKGQEEFNRIFKLI